jgi:hypothetical protein
VRALVLLGALVLAGCAQGRYYEAVSEEAVKEAKNIEAAALEDAPCLIGLGAWSRMPDERKRLGVFALCVSDAARFGIRLETK